MKPFQIAFDRLLRHVLLSLVQMCDPSFLVSFPMSRLMMRMNVAGIVSTSAEPISIVNYWDS